MLKIWLPILCFILLAPWSATIDLAASHYYYDATQSFADNDFLFGAYHWGFYPSWILFFIAVGFFVASYFRPYMIKWRQPAIVLILTYVMMVGAGVELIKSAVGRPRPRNVTEFKGEQTFRPFYYGERSGKSFPSGHAASGFYFLTLIPVGRRLGNRYIVYVGAAAGGILGGVLSWARIAQGGHFFTDCLASLLLVWVVANLLDCLITIKRK